MEFGGRVSRAAFVRMIDDRHDELRRVAGTLPMFGLADWPGAGLLGQCGWADDVLEAAGLWFGPPDRSGSWVEVVATAGPASGFVTELRGAAALEGVPVHDDEAFARAMDAVAAVPPTAVTIEVDGTPRRFELWAHGPIWYAALDDRPGIAVVAAGIEPEQVRLSRVADLEPYLAARKADLVARYDAADQAR